MDRSVIMTLAILLFKTTKGVTTIYHLPLEKVLVKKHL